MFKRWRRGETGPLGDADPYLSLLSRSDAARLVSMAQRAFADRGLDTSFDGQGSLVAVDGRQFGLSNLSAAVARTPRGEQSRVINAYARSLVGAESVTNPDTLEDARDLLMLKLFAVDQLQEVPSCAPEVLPGVLVLVALDHPTHVAHLTRTESLDPFGGWAAVEPIALDNLRRLPPPEHTARQASDEPDSTIHIFLSDDYYGASRLLVIDELLTSALRIERPSAGVLVAVPHRHMLIVHIVSGPGIVAAMKVMPAFAGSQYDQGVGSLSPHLYYRSADGETQRVSRVEDSGAYAVDVTGPFEEAWKLIGLLHEK